MNERKYDSTVARMAGNIAAGLLPIAGYPFTEDVLRGIAAASVGLSRLIIAETKRTEPLPDPPSA